MMRRWILMAGLMLATPLAALGGTYWVSTTGNNGNDGSAADDAHAWATIAYAVSQMSETSTINVLAGTYSGQILVANGLDGLTITVKPATGATVVITHTAHGTVKVPSGLALTSTTTLVFDATGGTMTVKASNAIVPIYNNGSNYAVLRFVGCTIGSETGTQTLVSLDNAHAANAGFEFDGCTIVTATLSNPVFNLQKNLDHFYLDDCTLTTASSGSGGSGITGASNSVLSTLRIRDTEWTHTVGNSAAYLMKYMSGGGNGYVANWEVDGCAFNTVGPAIIVEPGADSGAYASVTNNVFTQTATSGIKGTTVGIGMDSGSPPDKAFGPITVTGNRINRVNANLGHGLLVGNGANDAYVADNTIYGGCDYGISVKGTRVNLHYNRVMTHSTTTGVGIIVRYGANCRLIHNSVYAPSGAGISLDSTNTGYNIVARNIIASVSGIAADDEGTSVGTNRWDHNVYYRASGNLAQIGAEVKANLAAMQAAWATYTTNEQNDAHSVQATALPYASTDATNSRFLVPIASRIPTALRPSASNSYVVPGATGIKPGGVLGN